MAKRPKTIITSAITSATHPPPTMSPAPPYTAADIAPKAIAAA